MNPGHAQPSEPAWLYAACGALMLAGPVWQYLYVNRYPFDRPEAIVLPLAAGLVGAAIATVGRQVGGVLGGLIFGALLLAFVDLQLDLQERIRTQWVAAACLGLVLALRSKRAILASITLGAFYLASLPRPAPPTAPAAASPVPRPAGESPLLVHVLLDEQWGIGGMRAAGDPATAAFLTDFYLRWGFEVYEAAYSRWQSTSGSIPDLMSFGRPFQVERFGGPGARVRLLSNPYFERLRELGYAVHVYQSSYVDFCRSAGAAVASCEEAAGNSIGNIGYLPGNWTLRAALTGRYFLAKRSHVYNRLRPRDGETWRRSFAGRGLEELRDVRNAVAARPGRGTAIFVHLLLPHRPLEVDSDCRAYWHRPPVGPWAIRNVTIAGGATSPGRTSSNYPEGLSDSTWRARLALYGAQVRCVHREMARVLAAIDSTVGRDGAIVIVHGDHGSRMSPDTSRYARPSDLEGQRLNSAFSTLLAIRRPRVPAALRSDPVPVQDFFWGLVGNAFEGEVRAGWVHYVRNASRGSRLRRRDLLRRLSREEMLWARPIN